MHNIFLLLSVVSESVSLCVIFILSLSFLLHFCGRICSALVSCFILPTSASLLSLVSFCQRLLHSCLLFHILPTSASLLSLVLSTSASLLSLVSHFVNIISHDRKVAHRESAAGRRVAGAQAAQTAAV